jgi:CHAT domain-containing protein
MTQWLWQVIWQPLFSILSQYSAITLIPVGLLNLLPLHAAWRLDNAGHKRYLLDDVTIAYAPNALSLQKAKERATIKLDKLLAVDDPSNEFPSSTVEINTIAHYFKESQLFRHENATLEAVKKTLNPQYPVLHFSCHGKADFENPLQTGLLMANDKKLTVQDFFNAQLQARLVTLSACETGMIGMKQIEEVVGLPASLLQAGVGGVVASLWSVAEDSTALLMIRFYDHFMQNPNDIAIALKEAQIWLRDVTNRELCDWIVKRQLSFDPTQMGFFRRNALNNPDAKPFQSCYYWGAFYATGQ